MFSFIKTLRNDPSRIFPDRGLVGMDQPFLRAYTQVGYCTIFSSMWGILGLAKRSYQHDCGIQWMVMRWMEGDNEGCMLKCGECELGPQLGSRRPALIYNKGNHTSIFHSDPAFPCRCCAACSW